jgi:glutamate/tyrosine decarboxylase-like PLP-dependent enzyme
MSDRPLPAPIHELPRQGRPHAEILADLQALRRDDVDWRHGRVFSLVYHASDEHKAFLQQAHGTFFAENALNPLAFQSLKRMEKEVVRMAATLFHGGREACGTMTSGGTESLLMAVKTARDLARRKRPWVRRPNLVMPVSGHPAFDKGAHYFGLRLKKAPLRPDMRVDVKALRRLVDRNTVLIVGSAPQYPHGVVDPIEEIAAFAQERGVPCHVDACVGGFSLPFLERLGRPVPPWDFRVPGVTSISADLHKYGYTAKGASCIVYANIGYLKHQFFIATDFPGGVYVSPSMPGTRPGGTIAAAWAGLQAMGEDGYLEVTRRAAEAADRLRDGIEKTPGLVLLGGRSPTTIVCWASADQAVDVYAVADVLGEQGWLVDRQHRPPSVHLTVTANHLPVVDHYLRDLAAAVATVRAHPERKASGDAAMYGLMAKIPIRGAVRLAVEKVLEQMYGPDDGAGSAGGTVAGDGPLGQLIERYGARALEALETLERWRVRARRLLGRGE